MSERVPKQVGIRELKARLSAYVKWASLGHVITITDHGQPTARLVGPDAILTGRVPESLLTGVAEGSISPALSGRPLRPIDRVRSPMTIEQLLANDRGAE